MSVFARRLTCILGVLLILGIPLRAQENLDLGKTPAQLFASDCAACHKSPQGLAAKGGGMLGLENFLRQHYTASRESAAAIAGYLRAAGGGPAAAPSGRTGKRPPKGDEKAKKSDAPKSGAAKPGEAKPGEAKPGEGKPGEAKSGESKPSAVAPKAAEPKSAEPKAVEPKPAEPKASEPKPAEPKPAEPKSSEPKPAEPKPAESGKSD